jgi:hypothetical protein
MLITRIKDHDSLKFTLPDGTVFTVKLEIENNGYAIKTIANAPREIRVERVHFFSENKFAKELVNEQ